MAFSNTISLEIYLGGCHQELLGLFLLLLGLLDYSGSKLSAAVENASAVQIAVAHPRKVVNILGLIVLLEFSLFKDYPTNF